ncbi:MAG: FixH family protein [Sulfuricella denitrificans]|nr:FixH family protein [Sulfuricella denitrificans]
MTQSSKPWYREPWPWILMAGPAVVVVAGFVTAWLAVSTEDGMVEDDYYKKGLAINQTLARDQMARSLQLKAQLMLGSDATQLRVMLQKGSGDEVLPPILRLKILHPTRSDMDRVVMLKKSDSGYYEGQLKALEPTRWRLILEDADSHWRLSGKLHMPRESVAVMQVNG